jgi:hypothetical protein
MDPIMTEQAARLQADFQISISDDGNWQMPDLELLHASITLFAEILGGHEKIKRQIGDLLIERTNTGTSAGLAYKDRIKLSKNTPIGAWTVLHELAHVWDVKNQWALSAGLEKFTGGSTNLLLSSIKKQIPGQWDAGPRGAENKPGFYGRKPGVNAAGYFYGDKPSGANWRFNRKEDFAESVVMYCGWRRNNSLSKTAHNRIERYLLPNGTIDPIYHLADNWSDYASYFYPESGDYTKTKRWQFIDELINQRR